MPRFPTYFLTMILLAALSALSPVQQAAAAPENALGIVTGPHTGTYYRFGRDIEFMAAAHGLTVEIKESSGSVDNINRINSRENAALGIVQSDIMGFLSRSGEPQSRKVAGRLRMVLPFYQEEVHVLARKDVKGFADLNGRTLVTGPEGSGSWLTTINLLGITGVKPAKIVRYTPEEGLVEVLKGRADAMIFVAGKPVKLFQNLETLKGKENLSALLDAVHFLPMEDAKVLEEYAAAQIGPEDYDFVKTPVPAVAVTAVLVSFDFSGQKTNYAKSRCDAIRRLTSLLAENLEELRKDGHPNWAEVALNADVGIWRRDDCASLSPAGPAPSSGLEKELMNTLEDTKPR